ncbi:hypothetical protein P7C70_g8708, partial [Phenoliferia sp. Uapishka_3]
MSSPPVFSTSIPTVPSDFATSRELIANHFLPFVKAIPRTDELKRKVAEAVEDFFKEHSTAELEFWLDKILAPLEVGTLPIDFDSENYQDYHLYFKYILRTQSLDFMDDKDCKFEFWILTGTWRKSRSTRSRSMSRPGSATTTEGGGARQDERPEQSGPESDGDGLDEEPDYGDDEDDQEGSTSRTVRRDTSIEIMDRLLPPSSRPPPLPPVVPTSHNLEVPLASRLSSPPKVASTSRATLPKAFAPGGNFAPPRREPSETRPTSEGQESGWYTETEDAEQRPSKGKGTRRPPQAFVGHPFPADPAPTPLQPASLPSAFRKVVPPTLFPQISREEFWNQLGLPEAPRANASIAESADMQAHFAEVETTFNTPAVPRYDLTLEEVRTRQKQERFREGRLLPKVHPYNTYRVAAKCTNPIDPLDCLKILCGEFVDYEDIRDYSPTGIIHSPEDLQEFAIGATAAARSKRHKEPLDDYYQFARVRHTVNTYIRIHFPWRDTELAKWEKWMDDRALGASPDYIACLIAYERHARLEQERLDGRVASFSGAGDGSSLYVDFCISWNRDFHAAATPKVRRDRSPRTSDGGGSPTKKQKQKQKKREKVDEPCRRWNSGDNHPDDGCKYLHQFEEEGAEDEDFRSSTLFSFAPPIHELAGVSESAPRLRRKFTWPAPNLDPPRTPSIDATYTALPLPRPPPSAGTPAILRAIEKYPHLFNHTVELNLTKYSLLMADHPNQPWVSSLIASLSDGWWPCHSGAPSVPKVKKNRTFPSVPRSDEDRDLIEATISKQVENGWVSPAFDEDIEGIEYNDIFVNRREGKKPRIVNNQNDSGHNDNIDIDDCPITMDTVTDLLRILRHLHFITPERAQSLAIAWKLDIKAAFKFMCMHRWWQARVGILVAYRQPEGSTVKWVTRRHLEWRAAFGTRASPFLWTALNSSFMWICQFHAKIERPLAYVDDWMGIDITGRRRYILKDGLQISMPTDQARTAEVLTSLNVPWELEKAESGASLVITGILVDARKGTASLADEACLELIRKIYAFLTDHGRCPKLRVWRELAGHLNWSLTVFPIIRPLVNPIFAKLSLPHGQRKNDRFAPVWHNSTVKASLRDIVIHLSDPPPLDILDAGATQWTREEADIIIYTDACKFNDDGTGAGLGFYFEYQGETHMFYCRPGAFWESIIFAEAITVVAALLAAVARLADIRRVLILCDNSPSVYGFDTGAANDSEYCPLRQLVLAAFMS